MRTLSAGGMKNGDIRPLSYFILDTRKVPHYYGAPIGTRMRSVGWCYVQ